MGKVNVLHLFLTSVEVILLFCLAFYLHTHWDCKFLRELYRGNAEHQKWAARWLSILLFGGAIAAIPAWFYLWLHFDWLAPVSLALYIITLLLTGWHIRKQ